jgi:hypothetical protein
VRPGRRSSKFKLAVSTSSRLAAENFSLPFQIVIDGAAQALEEIEPEDKISVEVLGARVALYPLYGGQEMEYGASGRIPSREAPA